MSDQNGTMLSYQQAVDAARNLTATIRRLEGELGQAMNVHADAAGAFHAQFAHNLREQREAGATVEEAKAYARAQCAVLDRDRIRAEWKVKELLEKLEDRRGERHSLHRLIDWSMGRQPQPGEKS
jgi:hypothetical protein